MLRRNFIGSMIGTLLIEKVPFYAEAVTLRPRIYTVYERLDRFLTATPYELLQYKLLVNTEQGGLIYAPEMKEVGEGYFIAKPIECSQSFITRGATLVDDEGYKITEGNFTYPVCLRTCDILNVTYALSGREMLKPLLKQREFYFIDRIINYKTKAEKII